MTYAELQELEARVVTVERECRAIRGVLEGLMRCTCPVGFGQARDPKCVRHGTAANA